MCTCVFAGLGVAVWASGAVWAVRFPPRMAVQRGHTPTPLCTCTETPHRWDTGQGVRSGNAIGVGHSDPLSSTGPCVECSSRPRVPTPYPSPPIEHRQRQLLSLALDPNLTMAQELASQRKSVKRFAPEPIPEGLLKRCLKVAQRAPRSLLGLGCRRGGPWMG